MNNRVVADALVPPTAYAKDAHCGWANDEDGSWMTDCGGIFLIMDGTPSENSMRFCCYCGRPLLTPNANVTGLAPEQEVKHE